MKTVYSYDYEGKYIGEVEAELCQVTEMIKAHQSKRELKKGEAPIKSVYIMPSYSTDVKPPATEADEFAVFEKGVWVIKKYPEPAKEEKKAEKIPSYSELRAKEYPSLFEYIDGIVKGDAKQVQKYIDDCKAVKEKYPKPAKGKK